MLHLSPFRAAPCYLMSDAVPGKDKPCEIVEGIRGYWREGKEAFLKKDLKLETMYIGSCLGKKKN